VGESEASAKNRCGRDDEDATDCECEDVAGARGKRSATGALVGRGGTDAFLG
jgi:hypothetical protein